MMNRIVIVISILISCIACGHNEEYPNYIQTQLEQAVPDYSEAYDSIFIIPRGGCGSCKVQADKIIKKRVDNERNLFILTYIQNIKLLNIEIGKNRLKRANILIDTADIFHSYKLKESAYPTFFTKDSKGKLQFHNLLDNISD